jgi:hypothetical protein
MHRISMLPLDITEVSPHFAVIVHTKEQSIWKSTNWMGQGTGGELCKYIQDKFI